MIAAVSLGVRAKAGLYHHLVPCGRGARLSLSNHCSPATSGDGLRSRGFTAVQELQESSPRRLGLLLDNALENGTALMWIEADQLPFLGAEPVEGFLELGSVGNVMRHDAIFPFLVG